MNQDEQNLNLLSIFHYILGGLTVLGSFAFIFHVGVGIAMLNGTFDGKDAPPQVFGWMFIILGSLAIILGITFGILMIVAGNKLRNHQSRIFCLVIAGIECLNMPLGTILGIFTIITLLKESVIRMFESDGNLNNSYDL